MNPIIVDVFSGCGGFGLGAELAGFQSAIAVDIDPTLQSAYALNFPRTKTLQQDITTMEASAWRFLLGKTKIDGLIGGPPCQGFSRIGKNDKSDPRRTLVGHFFRTVNLLQPRFFVMENVEGLLDAGNREALDSAIDTVSGNYTILNPTIVDASRFGAPTKRKRVIIIGYQKSNMDPILEADILNIHLPPTNVRQAIRDLPQPTTGTQGEQEYGWATYATGNASNYAKKMRLPPPRGLGTELSRGMLASNCVSGCLDTKHSDSVVKRFCRTEPGKVEPISRYPRLDWFGLCPTLRAGTGSDRGNYQAMRPLHPEQPRVITVREAARLQGFPDWFLFHRTKHHSFRMIGNSVSPIVAEKMLSLIKGRLSSKVESSAHPLRTARQKK
jgi:DNA (cytosine-5)-methyltransferase 1